MKPTQRPAPRTLAAPPPSPLRAPQATLRGAAFPTLAAAVAGGVALPACEAPRCGDTRADELERHGRMALRAEGVGDAVTEIGVALGVVPHRATRAVPPSGGARAVTELPRPPSVEATPVEAPPVETPPMRAMGEPARVDPSPLPVPPRVTDPAPRTTVRSPGRPPAVQPTGESLHRTPARGGVRPTYPAPRE